MKTVESLYLLWRTTGEAKWREYGWTIFQAIEHQCKTYSGYASLSNVEKRVGVKANDMPRCVPHFMLLTVADPGLQLFHGGNVRVLLSFVNSALNRYSQAQVPLPHVLGERPDITRRMGLQHRSSPVTNLPLDRSRKKQIRYKLLAEPRTVCCRSLLSLFFVLVSPPNHQSSWS